MKSDHFDGKKFFNPGLPFKKTFLDLLRWQAQSRLFHRKSWDTHHSNCFKAQPLSQTQINELGVTFINHATLLIQMDGKNILTDPVFSHRLGPVSFVGPHRYRPAGMKLEELPQIDLVLVSHNHFDHMDSRSLAFLHRRWNPDFLCALGDQKHLQKFGIPRAKIHPMDWWEAFSIQNLKLSFLPAQHWSGRGLHDRMTTVWGGFWLHGSTHQVLFAGDSGYGPHFGEIYKRLGTPDLSLLPIGAYEPRWFMKDQHMNPAEAVQAHVDLRSKKSMGIHFGTWQLTDESEDQPAIDLKMALQLKEISEQNFLIPQNGQSFIF